MFYPVAFGSKFSFVSMRFDGYSSREYSKFTKREAYRKKGKRATIRGKVFTTGRWNVGFLLFKFLIAANFKLNQTFEWIPTSKKEDEWELLPGLRFEVLPGLRFEWGASNVWLLDLARGYLPLTQSTMELRGKHGRPGIYRYLVGLQSLKLSAVLYWDLLNR